MTMRYPVFALLVTLLSLLVMAVGIIGARDEEIAEQRREISNWMRRHDDAMVEQRDLLVAIREQEEKIGKLCRALHNVPWWIASLDHAISEDSEDSLRVRGSKIEPDLSEMKPDLSRYYSHLRRSDALILLCVTPDQP